MCIKYICLNFLKGETLFVSLSLPNAWAIGGAHVCIECLLSTFFVPGTVLSWTLDIKSEKWVFVLRELAFYWREIHNKWRGGSEAMQWVLHSGKGAGSRDQSFQ